MLNKLHFFLSTQLKQKRSYPATKNSGFTLIELLVAMILAVLVITPLLGFMISIMETDRNEQAKANSEQEVQAALNYINQDLQQAIYIYDAKGIKAIKDQLRYPDDTDKVPVLVFWKRQFKKNVIKATQTSNDKNDSFVYSLVVYYLIENNQKDSIWSNQFQIKRFEVKDGIRDPDEPINADGSPKYIKNEEPDKGFALFKLSDPEITGTLEEKMNAWKKKIGEAYTKDALTLIDYVDSSPQNTDDSLKPVDCTKSFFNIDNVPVEKQNDKKEALRVPADASSKYSYSSNTNLNNGSFYACVDIDKNAAQVYIRGNALARIYSDKDKNQYKQNRSSYFPKVSIQVKGRGIIGAE